MVSILLLVVGLKAETMQWLIPKFFLFPPDQVFLFTFNMAQNKKK